MTLHRKKPKMARAAWRLMEINWPWCCGRAQESAIDRWHKAVKP